MAVQQYAIGQMTAPREKAIAALMELQALGVTDGEILNIYEWLNKMREKPLSPNGMSVMINWHICKTVGRKR